jgi:hypothetical protein
MNPNRARLCYRLLVECYPLEFRRRYGEEMIRQLDSDWERARATGTAGTRRFWTDLLLDFAKSWPGEVFAAVPRGIWILLAILAMVDAFALYALNWRLQVIASAVAWFGSLLVACAAYFLRPAKALGLVFLYALVVFFLVRIAPHWLDLRSPDVHTGFALRAFVLPIMAMQGLGFAMSFVLPLKRPGLKANLRCALFFVAPLLAGVSLALAGVAWNFVIWGSTWGLLMPQPLGLVFRAIRHGDLIGKGRPAKR